MDTAKGVFGLAVIIAWIAHIVILLSQAYHETLTAGKAVFHAVGVLLPPLAPITVWFV